MASEPSWYHGIESFTGIDLDGDGIIGAPGKAAAPSSEELLPEELLPEDDFEAELQPGSEEKPKEETSQVTSAGPSRTRRMKQPVSVGQYNQWMLVDVNKRIADGIREEERTLQRRRAESTQAYHEARAKKTSVGRGQQELTASALREYHGGLTKQGEQGRSELMRLRAIALRQKKEWAAHGARNAARLGLEQKKRVLEARAERFQARRNAALQTKNEAAARRVAAQSAQGERAQEQQARLQRVRENTPTSESLAEAREFFLKQKREAAADLRSSVRDWESARSSNKSTHLAKATDNKNVVLATRASAQAKRANLKAERQEMGAKIREAIRQMESGRMEQLQIENAYQEQVHHDLYDAKFVDDEAATRVDESEYGQLIAEVKNYKPRSGSFTGVGGSAVSNRSACSASGRTRSDSKPKVERPWVGPAGVYPSKGGLRPASPESGKATVGGGGGTSAAIPPRSAGVGGAPPAIPAVPTATAAAYAADELVAQGEALEVSDALDVSEPIAEEAEPAEEPSLLHGIEEATGLDLDGDGKIGDPGAEPTEPVVADSTKPMGSDPEVEA